MGSRASLCLEADRREVGQCFSLPLPEQPRSLASQVPRVPVPSPRGIYSAGTCRGSQWNSCFLIWEKGAVSTGNCRKMNQRQRLPLSAGLTRQGGFSSCTDSTSHPHHLDSSVSLCPRAPGAEWILRPVGCSGQEEQRHGNHDRPSSPSIHYLGMKEGSRNTKELKCGSQLPLEGDGEVSAGMDRRDPCEEGGWNGDCEVSQWT